MKPLLRLFLAVAISGCATSHHRASVPSSGENLEKIRQTLAPSLEIPLDSRGLAQAANRTNDGSDDPTHYDAVWVRDNLWVYLGLKTRAEDQASAKRLLLTLADYFASKDQTRRFKNVIANPKILHAPDGAMQAVHIRFDRKSKKFADVTEYGKPQIWNHKQNDALGLFLDLFCRSVLEGEITKDDLTPARTAMIARIPRYFEAIRFDSMPDAGSWEEIERVNTSSIALVTSGLERLLESRDHFRGIRSDRLKLLINHGYSTLFKQLDLGGESPQYRKTDPRYRTSDAALLNLIYPARLSRLQERNVDQVFKALEPLIGEVGIKRYIGDSYQSGNFWIQKGKTDDTSSDSSFADRGSKFIAGTEAQWFFDSWYATALNVASERFKNSTTYGNTTAKQLKFLNRALAQVTPKTRDTPTLGADGKPVPPAALPESYNTLVDLKTGARKFAPSPITPLNWAKAAMRIALDRISRDTR